MLYAEVVLGVLVEGPFDYIIPDSLAKKITVGIRVWVDFGNKKSVGYVVKIKTRSAIKKLKNISALIDETAIIDADMLRLAKEVSDYYCCSLGQAIESAIPRELRSGKAISYQRCVQDAATRKEAGPAISLAQVLDRQERWKFYIERIRETLDNGKGVIFLLPDIKLAALAQAVLKENLGFLPEVVSRRQPKELELWVKIRQGLSRLVIGARSGVFAPIPGLGLIIIEEEQNPAYKQEQSPHYHAREVAIMRAKIAGAKLILGSHFLSLESFYLNKKHKAEYFAPQINRDAPEVKIINMKNLPLVNKKRHLILSQYLYDALISVINQKGKALLFLNRKGFATFAHCNSCGMVLRCQRCNVNLVYHFQENALACHYCNFKIEPPKICPGCNSNYIEYSGIGTEKIESELSRIFPQALIKRLDNENDAAIEESGIFVATEFIINTAHKFNLIAALSIDNYLNRVDFRSAEKAFSLLAGFLALAQERLIIQTNLPGHYCFKALAKKDLAGFYKEELKQRRQLRFAPYQHMALLKVRGKNEGKAKKAAGDLFDKLKETLQDKHINILSVNPGYPAKLRGKFYWQILLMSASAVAISKFLKKRLNSLRYSGITTTVDIDPA